MRLSILVALAVIVAGCSSGSAPGGGSSRPAAPTQSTVATTPAASSPPPVAAGTSTAPAPSALAGAWKGRYSGAYQGTFALTWQQSGSKLTGTIHLSAPSATLNINGTVQGSAIRFGTVGAYGISYTGSVSGSSMSGTYQVQGSAGGPWSASKA